MNLLLDTHAFVWWIRGGGQLTERARDAISTPDTQVSVSEASASEMSIKVGLGKWPEADELLKRLEAAVADEGFELLGITVDHVRMAGLMPHAHRDPFDRLLSAQATIEGLTLVSADVRLRALGAPCLW